MPIWTERLDQLGVPSPPDELATRVVHLDETTSGTRRGAPALRGYRWFVDEVRDGAAGDYVLAGLDDLATGVPAVHYYLRWRQLALFLQIRLVVRRDGSLELDEAGRAALEVAGTLPSLLERSIASGALDESGVLLVVQTPFGSQTWEWTGRAPSDGVDGLAGAAEWVGDQL